MKTPVITLPTRSLKPGKKIYFISDLHLGAPYSNDSLNIERKVVSFLDSISEDADTIFLLGDIIDYWFEYKNVVPKGYIRFFGKLAQLADRGVRLVWIIGNHDIWLKDYFSSQFDIEIYDGLVRQKIDSSTFLLGHGDGVGKIPPVFAFIRSVFRNKVCQKLYGAIHPRWTIPFALAWSEHSRRKGMEKEDNTNMPLLKSLIDFSTDFSSKDKEIDYFVFGHLHIVAERELKTGARLFISGDWISHFTYLSFDGNTLTTHQY